MEEGLKEAAEWYLENGDEVNKKPYFEFIDESLRAIINDNKVK